MLATDPSLSKPVSIQLAKTSFSPGDVLNGEVHLLFPTVLENKYKEVHVKLYGSLHVTIAKKSSDGLVQLKVEHDADLIKDKKTVWERGTYPTPDSHILRAPFHFDLPSSLAATCKHRATNSVNREEIVGEISYYLEVVGSRGTLHTSKRERTPVRVVAPSARGTQIQQRLSEPSGWPGKWRTVSRYINIPVGNAKRTARVEMKFVFPDTEVIPSSTFIPFILTVTSHSPRIHVETSSEFEFVDPPSRPLDIDFRLERVLRIQPQGAQNPLATATNTIIRLGGMGPGQVVKNGGPVETTVSDRIWAPELHDSSRGSWRQESEFKSRFRLICPPTLVTELMRVEYRLYLKVNMQGVKEVIECQVPVNVVAGTVSPDTPSLEESGPMPESPGDSPPAYFDVRRSSGPTVLPSAFRENDTDIHRRLRSQMIGQGGPSWL